VARRWLEAWRAWWPARPRPLPPAEHRRVLAAARLERHGGLTVLYLAGTPYEMGYQHGVLARGLIHGFRHAAYDYVTALMQGAIRPALPGWLARPLLFSQAAAYWPTIPRECADEIAGIADGSGVHPIEVLVSTAIWEMYLVSGCSEFAVVGPATADGSLLHGYNYDLMHPDHALIQPYLAAIFCRPSQGLPFITVNTVGSVGANAGMNEAGLSVAWDNTYLKDDTLISDIELPVVPFIITLRRLLQHGSNLEQAVQIVTGTLPRPLADIVIVGSARESRAVALETAGSVHAIREMAGEAIWSTNCFRSAQLAALDRRGDGRGLPGASAWQRFPRYQAYGDLFATYRGGIAPATVAAMLRDPYPREADGAIHPNPAPRATICRDITSWSLVMQPGLGRLWVSDTVIPGCQGTFFAFDLAGWQRLPGLDLAASGYHDALQAARLFLAGDLRGARQALDAAESLDGKTAPLLLMKAAMHGVAEEEELASETLRQVIGRYSQSPAGALARAWLEGNAGTQDVQEPALPFPSAIRPLLYLQRGDAWEARVVPAQT